MMMMIAAFGATNVPAAKEDHHADRSAVGGGISFVKDLRRKY